ncbi:MAG: hypothetical protein GY838_16135 [bacterium]|nr:hypothetical protein [bacterium]
MSSMIRLLAVTVCLLLSGDAIAHEIHDAARSGDLAQVEALVAADPALAFRADERDCRPLHFACGGGHVQVMEFLLAAGADLTTVDTDGDTPLHWAAIAGHTEAVRELIAHGAALEARNHQEDSPLLYAVKRRHLAAATALLDAGADTEAANDYGRTPLLWVARETNDVPMARLLLERGAQVDAGDRFDATPLALASWRGFRVLVDLFLDAGADVHATDNLGYHMFGNAVEKGLERLYTALLDAGLTIDTSATTGHTLLHTAAVGGSAVIVADLLERGLPVDTVDAYGWTPLHHTADKGRDAVTAALLDAGADPDLRTLSGFSPRNLAERADAPTVIARLESRTANRDPRRLPVLTGPYLGQGEPPARPELFAPDLVATPHGGHGSITFTPDGSEAYWSMHTGRPDSGYTRGTIFTSRIVDGRWAAPAKAPFAAEWGDDVPFITADGRRLFFISRLPVTPGATDGAEHIWVCDRTGEGWGEPRPLSSEVNSMPQHWQFSVDAAGNLYFASRRGTADTDGIYVSRPVNGRYTAPEFLGFAGEAPFIAPDGSYLLTCEFTRTGLHNLARFLENDGSWSDPVDLTAETDGVVSGMCPMISPDGKALFFMRDQDSQNVIWWMSTGFLEDMRAKTLGGTVPADLRYLGQTPPGRVPEKFAPGLISTDRWEASGTLSPAGDEYFFTRRPTHGGSANRLWWTRIVDGAWTATEPAPFGVEAMEFEPHITPDGTRLYYNSMRAHPETGTIEDSIWYAERQDGGWSRPQYLDDAVNDGWAMYVSADRTGKLYFTGMYIGAHGIFTWNEGDDRPEPLPEAINGVGGASHPFIEKDGRFLLFDGQPDGWGRSSLYVSRGTPDGGWAPARRLGPEINATETENCASLSPDGKYLFFYRDGDIWWVDAAALEPYLAD